MDDNRLHKYYRNQGFSWRTLVYNYLLTDRYFREIFHFGPYCGPLTAITFLLVLLVLVYTTTCGSGTDNGSNSSGPSLTVRASVHTRPGDVYKLFSVQQNHQAALNELWGLLYMWMNNKEKPVAAAAAAHLDEKIESWSIFLVNVKRYNDLRGSVEKKVPTQDSVQQLKPGYVCINKHLMQAGVFLDKTQKVLLKEQMEIDMLNSRMNSIFELLQPSEKSGSKSHRDFYNFDSSLQKTEFI